MSEKCKHLEIEWEWGAGKGINEAVDYDEETKSYAISGCCGGGCYVIYGIKYCPFCGEKLTPPKEEEIDMKKEAKHVV